MAPPSTVVPSVKVTRPVGVPAPGATGTTVAVRVTACPSTEGFGEVSSVVVVFALATVRFEVPVLPAKLGSPE